MSTDGTLQTPSPPAGKSPSGPIDDFLGMIARTIIQNRLGERKHSLDRLVDEDPNKPNGNNSP